jgi:hypothetical protein
VAERGYWSPDSRWFAFLAGDPVSLFVVRFDGNEPGPAIELTPGMELELAGANTVAFAPDSQRVVFTATAGGEARVQEVALDGDAPGPPQPLTPPLANVWFELADDGRSLLYTAAEVEGGPHDLWWIDRSENGTGEPLRLDDTPDAPDIFTATLAPTHTHAIFRGIPEAGGDASTLVNVKTLARHSLGPSITFSMMRPLR